MFWKKKPPSAPPAPPAPKAPPATSGPLKAPNAAELQQIFGAGFQFHQNGKLSDAAACYRRVLAASPAHFAARHLLGVIALQEGRLDEARDEITLALQSNPKDGPAFSNLGTVHLRSGRLGEARASYETALSINPRDANAAASLASVLQLLGDPKGAVKRLREAIAASPTAALRNELGAALLQAGDAAGAVRELEALLKKQPGLAPAHNNLGLALEKVGDKPRALQAYDRAIELDPASAAAIGNRASLLVALGRPEEARLGFERALKLNPQDARANANLGALLRELGLLSQARAALDRALALEPRLFEARFNRIQVVLATGEIQQAQALADALVKDEPRSADSYCLRAQVLQAQSRLTEAEAALVLALTLDPNHAQSHHLRGLVLMAKGDAEGARASHEEALRLDPAHTQARWAAVMARLPALWDQPQQADEGRVAFVQGVESLDAFFSTASPSSGSAVVGSTQPFYLAYQRGNHRPSLELYGRLCVRLMEPTSSARHTPPARIASPAYVRGGPIRVGIVSAHFRDHSVWTAIVRGWAAQLDPKRFELSAFAVGGTADAQTAIARELIPKFDHRGASATEWAERIAAAAPQILLYPEVGMDSTTLKLAAQRLAPTQLAAWGHPLTTGLATIDAFISAEAFEPPDAHDHYVESLVALPGLGVHYESLSVHPEAFDRAQHGFPPDAPLLLCAGLPHKYTPDYDDLWAEIAERLPQARLVFFRGGAAELADRLAKRLGRAFASRGLKVEEHAVWISNLSRPQFFALMRQATLYLDSAGFSGFNTAMQAVECGLPIVALEGDSLRGRFGSGILRQAGLDECVAIDLQQYVGIAVSLVGDAGQRTAIAAHMRKHRSRLFSTGEPVSALAAYLESRADVRSGAL